MRQLHLSLFLGAWQRAWMCLGARLAICVVWQCAMHKVLLTGFDLHLPSMFVGVRKSTPDRDCQHAPSTVSASGTFLSPGSQMVT